MNEYHCPVAVISVSEDDSSSKGSVRSPKGWHVHEILKSIEEELEHFGGHESAGGFSIQKKNIELFKLKFKEACQKNKKNNSNEDLLWFQNGNAMKLNELNEHFFFEYQLLEPFGIGNPEPEWVLQSTEVKNIKILSEKHSKIIIENKEQNLKFDAFIWDEKLVLKDNEKINLLFSPQLSSFKGVVQKQLQIKKYKIEEFELNSEIN